MHTHNMFPQIVTHNTVPIMYCVILQKVVNTFTGYYIYRVVYKDYYTEVETTRVQKANAWRSWRCTFWNDKNTIQTKWVISLENNGSRHKRLHQNMPQMPVYKDIINAKIKRKIETNTTLGEIFSMVGIDLITIPSCRGYNYIITATDYHSKYFKMRVPKQSQQG